MTTNGFKSPLLVERDMSEEHRWILKAPLIYKTGDTCIIVKKDFDFDFASSPQLPVIAWLYPKSGTNMDRAAALHDALYVGEIYPRDKCDALFLEAMQADGVSYAKRYVAYWTVRALGGLVWLRHDPLEIISYKYFVKVEKCRK